jgi:hypothetical protein
VGRARGARRESGAGRWERLVLSEGGELRANQERGAAGSGRRARQTRAHCQSAADAHRAEGAKRTRGQKFTGSLGLGAAGAAGAAPARACGSGTHAGTA